MFYKSTITLMTAVILAACSTTTQETAVLSTGKSAHEQDEVTSSSVVEVIEHAELAQEAPMVEMMDMAMPMPAAPVAAKEVKRSLQNQLTSKPVIDNLVMPIETGENYAQTQLNSVKSVLTHPVSTFSTDTDTASYTNARRFLVDGQRPPADAIRVEEFINYFDYHLASPENLQEPIGIETELMVTPWNEQTHLMRVSLQAYRSNFDDLPPLNLVFLLDVSGSMGAPDKLPLMQRAFNLLVQQLRPQDHVAIAVYAGNSGVVLEPTSGDNKAQINRAINRLQAGGSTHGSAGIHLAYELAQQHFDANGINRIILGTDGDFNVGTTSIDALKDLIESKRESGVFLSVLGFGTGNYNDYLMEEMSNHGNGNAYYIDSYQEARKIFSEQLTSTLQTVAKDVKIQVEFNPAQVAEYRLVGYDNRQLNREDFNNDKIDAGEMGSGHTVTALYELVLTNSDFRFTDPLRYQPEQTKADHSAELAFVKVRYKLPDQATSQLMTTPVLSGQTLEPTSTMQFASAVTGFAEYLRNSQYLMDWSLESAINDVNRSLKDDRWGYRSELLQLMKNIQAQEHS